MLDRLWISLGILSCQAGTSPRSANRRFRSCIPCMVYIYSKSAILEMGFRTFRLKLCSKYTKHLVSIESYISNWLFFVFGHLRTQKQDNPKNHYIQILIRLPSPYSHFPTSPTKILGFIQGWQCCIAFLRWLGSPGSLDLGNNNFQWCVCVRWWTWDDQVFTVYISYIMYIWYNRIMQQKTHM